MILCVYDAPRHKLPTGETADPITVPGGALVGAAAGAYFGGTAGRGVGTTAGYFACASGGGSGSKFGTNQHQNKMANDAKREAERNTGKRFTPALERKFHDEITGQGINDYHELVHIAEDVLEGRI